MRVVRIDWRTALAYVFRDPAWKRRIGLGGLLLPVVPPLGWLLALGYRSLVGNRLVDGVSPLLPDWRGNVALLLRRGAASSGVILGYLTPFVVAYWILGPRSTADLVEQWRSVAAFIGAAIAFPPGALPTLPVFYGVSFDWLHFSPTEIAVPGALFLAPILLMPAAFLQVARHRRFAAAYDVAAAWRLVKSSPRLYVEAWVVSLVVSGASVALVPLMPWLLFWSYLVISHVFLQVLARSLQSEVPDMTDSLQRRLESPERRVRLHPRISLSLLALAVIATAAFQAKSDAARLPDPLIAGKTIETPRMQTAAHPRLLFSANDIPAMAQRAKQQPLEPLARHLLRRADALLTAPPIVPSVTRRGEPDPPGEQKGIASARALQGRVLTYAMAFTLTRDRKYRDAVVNELRRTIDDWRIWVDTAHAPPYDLMTGEICLTFGLAYDWLYHDLTPAERRELRTGVERRGLQAYLDSAAAGKASFFTARHNWNPVCNGGAAVLALALEGESDYSDRVLKIAVPAMDHYWNHLAEDGGWDEGTGYWRYGHRYAFIAAEALRRSGRASGAGRFALPGAKRTGYFPIVFGPGTTLTAGFGDSNSRVSDPILYLLGREYQNPDFIWFQDRAPVPSIDREGWPSEALTLIWRPVGEPWLPEATPTYTPKLPPTYAFESIGWGFMAPKQPDPPFFLSFKNGSLAANHTHLDLNHINVGVGDTMLLVELGSRPYPADYFSAKRYSYYEIGTRGHNTVLIGGKGQTLKKVGKLLTQAADGVDTFVGVADGAYEVETTRVRRHVAFVDKSAWVVLDEIVTPQAQPVELRFHTYGAVAPAAGGTWRVADAGRALDLTVSRALTANVETPDGWIRPVRVLSLKSSQPSTEHALVTVIQPRVEGATSGRDVDIRQTDSEIAVTVGTRRVAWRKTAEGWR